MIAAESIFGGRAVSSSFDYSKTKKKNEKILSLKNAESNERRWRPGHWLRSLTS